MTTPSTTWPKMVHPLRFAANGDIPDQWFARSLIDAHNHNMAYRRKAFFSSCSGFNSTMGNSTTTTTYWRARVHTGYGATELRFRVGMGRRKAATAATDPRVDIDVTIAGGATTTVTQRHGAHPSGSSGDTLSELGWYRLKVPVSGNTTYEIAVKGVDGGRPISICGYEYANPTIDDATNYYVEKVAGHEQPIDDAHRQAILQGASLVWLTNGAHLLNWSGNGVGTAQSVTGSTYRNLFDGTSTSVSASTLGYTFSSAGTGATALATLEKMARLKDATSLACVIAVYGNVSAGTGGQVRLVNTAGTSGPAVGSIGTTLQWYAQSGTWSGVDALGSDGKMDLQARDTGGGTINVYAVSVYLVAN